MKAIYNFISICTFLFFLLLSTSSIAAEKFVAITQIVAHPALDSVRKGVKDVLAEKGLVAGKNLKWEYESAQGNQTTAAQIAQKFAGEAPDVIVAIATPSAQSIATAAHNIPVVFSAVTDPVGARLVKTLKHPGYNITGTTDMLPVKKHLELIKRLVPNAKTIGTIYNPGEANSVSLIKSIKSIAPSLELKVITAAATKSSDVLGAARSLVGKVDAIYLPTDNTVISAAEAVIQVGKRNHIPVIAADTDTVKRGAVAALGFNYYDVGRQTGEMVYKVLKGTKPGNIDVEGVHKVSLYLNSASAKAMGVNITPDLLHEAKVVINK
jgi:putative ABC transport system substrate-binding protein